MYTCICSLYFFHTNPHISPSVFLHTECATALLTSSICIRLLDQKNCKLCPYEDKGFYFI
uniref:Uncharacterized protein n=1 Tax=Anguilla anguilla TaxID=7936 RepID=A0A0E9UXL2_ANGAN